MGTTVEALARLTSDQLNWVWKYFAPYKSRLKARADIYMAIFWTKAVGQQEDFALSTGGVAYRQNAGFDTNKHGKVTKREAAAKVVALLNEELLPGNRA